MWLGIEDTTTSIGITEEITPDEPEERITDWYQVSERVFNQHVDDMGINLFKEVQKVKW